MSVPHCLFYCELGREGERGGGEREKGEGGRRRERRGKEGEGSVPHCTVEEEGRKGRRERGG